MISKRHHYVPQFYMANFATDNGKGTKIFWVYDKRGNTRIQTPINTAVESGLNYITLPDGSRSDLIETGYFAPLDGAAAEVIASLQRPTKVALTNKEANILARFIAACSIRVRQHLDTGKEMGEQFVAELLRQHAGNKEKFDETLHQAAKLAANPESFKSAANAEDPESFVANREFILAASLDLVEPLSKEIISMRWNILRAPEGHPFITSDSPVAVSAIGRENTRPVIGVGFGLPDAEIFFPISPKLCIYLSRKTHRPFFLDAKPSTVRYANRMCAYLAREFVISSTESPRIRKLVQKFKSTLGKSSIDKAQMREVVKQIIENDARSV